MGLDNVTFLIMWFLIMFITISSGIIVIMYRVGCFQCTKKVGVGDIVLLEKLTRSSQQATDQQQPAPPPGGPVPQKMCTVCGEPLTAEDEADNSHPACRDMDAAFF